MRGLRATAVIGLAGLLIAVGATDALAHAGLRSSDPAAGSTLGASPTVVELTFSEQPDPALSVIHVLLSAGLITLILMHSGRDTGLGGMGFTPQSQGGTHIVERNLTRMTVALAVLFFLNTIVLFRLLD